MQTDTTPAEELTELVWQALARHGVLLDGVERGAVSGAIGKRLSALSSAPADAREALERTQRMLETIDRTNSTNFAEVRERIVANRAALERTGQ